MFCLQNLRTVENVCHKSPESRVMFEYQTNDSKTDGVPFTLMNQREKMQMLSRWRRWNPQVFGIAIWWMNKIALD